MDEKSAAGKQQMEFLDKDFDWDKISPIFTPEKESILKRLSKDPNTYLLAKDVLLVLAAVGLLGLAVIMPGTAGLVTKGIKSSQKRSDFNKRLSRLEKRGLVEIFEDKGETVVKITKQGVERALHYKFEKMEIKKPNRWDKKWRVVIFDIPETKRSLRDKLRNKLKELGFYSLNESVFVHAYPCLDEIEFIRQVFSVGGEVTYIVAESIEHKEDLISWFDLG